MVERQLPKLDVAGSSPVFRSKNSQIKMAMKNKKILIAAFTLAVVIAVAIISICLSQCKKPPIPENPPPADSERLHTLKQYLDYTESIDAVDNPDQGFYRPIYVWVGENGVNYNKAVINDSASLYHLRIDISAFSEVVNGVSDKSLSAAAIEGIDGLLSILKQNNKNAIVRFAYDSGYNGNADSEPSPSVINNHIKQFCPTLNKYPNTVTAVETGLIGPWGEMHTSKIATPEHITPIIETFLSNCNLPVLVRTPKMIYDYLGITVNDIGNYTIDADNKAYRLGIFNDGYLGSSSDLGTYTDREKEIEFLSKQTNHLPFGGEAVVPDSKLHDIDVCLPEMKKIHLNYLNIEWHSQVIDKWKNTFYSANCGDDELYYGQTAFTYIRNRMGYRYVLTDSTFEYSDKFDKLNVKLTLKNVGFGNLNKQKSAQLIFTDENGEIKYTETVDGFSGGDSINRSVSLDLKNGKYDVYLRLYGEEIDGRYLYALRFVNGNIWNKELNANKIGKIEIRK